MTNWTRTEEVVKTIKYKVPAPWPQGATWTDVTQALRAARKEATDMNNGEPVGDDTVWVKAEDDRIVISFEAKTDAP